MDVNRIIIWMRVMLWFYWKKIFEACKILVDVIFHGEINIFLTIIPFQLNSTKTFAIPINSDIVVFLNVFIRCPSLCFPKQLAPKFSMRRLNTVGCVV